MHIKKHNPVPAVLLWTLHTATKSQYVSECGLVGFLVPRPNEIASHWKTEGLFVSWNCDTGVPQVP